MSLSMRFLHTTGVDPPRGRWAETVDSTNREAGTRGADGRTLDQALMRH
jgi:hypothetical protein